MTRVKETIPGNKEVPAYKSHPSRIVISLRKGYDNLRKRCKEKSEQIASLRGKKRDLEKSRNKWKAEACTNKNQLNQAKVELEKARAEIEKLKKKH
jgi:chromosome segregation ATPase